MARSSRGGRGGGTSIATRILLTLLALATLAFGFAILWSRTDDGLIARARLGLPVDRTALARTLAKTLRTTLIDFGISPGAQLLRPLATGGPRGALFRWTAYLSGRASTLQLNERLTENLGRRHAQIVDAWEDTLAAPGSGVHLLVGAGSVVTHELVLERRNDVVGALGTEPARLLLVVDSFGPAENDSLARRVFDLGVPFTAAVLPRLKGTKAWIERLTKAGAPVLVQLPMEPMNYPKRDPGPGAVIVDMSAGQIVRTVRKDVGDVPHAVGATSYMGQMALGDDGAMGAVMQELKRADLFYLDVHAVPTSVAADHASRAGVLCFRADAILESMGSHDAQVRALGHLLDDAVDLARRRGYAIVVAHPDDASLDVLKRAIPKLKRSGVRFESLQTLLEPRAE
jgi:polysaccharide deacetylase 2 family uncharacterized protein YibQ